MFREGHQSYDVFSVGNSDFLAGNSLVSTWNESRWLIVKVWKDYVVEIFDKRLWWWLPTNGMSIQLTKQLSTEFRMSTVSIAFGDITGAQDLASTNNISNYNDRIALTNIGWDMGSWQITKWRVCTAKLGMQQVNSSTLMTIPGGIVEVNCCTFARFKQVMLVSLSNVDLLFSNTRDLWIGECLHVSWT